MDKVELKEQIKLASGNLTEVARSMKISVSTIHYHVARDEEIAEVVAVARGKKLVKDPQFFDSKKTNFRTDVKDDEIYVMLVDCEGDVTHCAERLELHPLTLRKRINGNPMLIDGKQDGIELKHDRIRDSLYRAATGEEQIPASEMRAKELIARTQMGWAQKSVVKVNNTNFDKTSVPLKDVPTDKPVLRRVK